MDEQDSSTSVIDMNDVAFVSREEVDAAHIGEDIAFEMTFQRKSDLRLTVNHASLPKADIGKIYEVILKFIAKGDLGDSHNFVGARDAHGRYLATGEGLFNFVVTIVAQAERRTRAELDDRPRKGY
jgi:hypothetical protein